MIEEISIKKYPSLALQSFDCGEEKLNIFLHSFAKQNDARGLGRTFLLIENDEVIGFYTLSSAQIEFGSLPVGLSKRLPRYPLPAIRIARLAVNKSHQGKGCGATLLRHAFKRIVLAAVNAGVAFVLVDAKDQATSFYEHYGFVRLEKEGNTFVLPIETVLKAIMK